MLAYPSDQDFLEFFEGEAIERDREEQFYCYQYKDKNASKVYFSFHAVESSVQVRLVVHGYDILVWSSERAKEVSIERDLDGSVLKCDFDISGVDMTAVLRLSPEVKFSVYTLVDHTQ